MQTVNNHLQNFNAYNQSFTGIKKVKCLGLYEKYPDLGKELVDTFKNNSKAMDFCKKYDVNIIFHAAKDYIDSVKSSVNIFYDNVTKSKFKKFFNNHEDRIEISGWGNEYNIADSLKEATESLKSAISSAGSNTRRPTGLLDAHIDLADKKMQEVLDQKALAEQNKLAKAELKKRIQSAQLDEKARLNNSIKDLINKSS